MHADSASRIAGDTVGAAGAVRRAAWVLEARQPAVVLGSAEPLDHIDQQAAHHAGLEVARRRSGGAGVIVGRDRCLWIDLVIPRGDPLWDDDIGRGAWWVGQLWVEALTAIGVTDVELWQGPLRRSQWSDRACFAGLGPGEVTVQGGKVVGVSQRRTKAGALFQCAVLLAPDGPGPDALAELVSLQAMGAAPRNAMLSALRCCTFPLPPGDSSLLCDAVRSLLDAF